MVEYYRHHHAHREIIFIEVPTAGSPKEGRRGKPPAYPTNQRAPWQPQRSIPAKRGKAEALRKLLEQMNRQEQELRAFMAEARRRAAA